MQADILAEYVGTMKGAVHQWVYKHNHDGPNDGQPFSLILPYANSDAMNIFLQEFSKAFQKYRIILIMDMAAWYRSKDLSKVENIRYIYQPPYSPELNPVGHP